VAVAVAHYCGNVSRWNAPTVQAYDDTTAIGSAATLTESTSSTNTQTVTLSGVTYARFIEIINGFTVEFEDGTYGVIGQGANTNLLDVKTDNQVSYLGNNSAGLIVTTASGLTPEEAADLNLMLKLLRNRRQQDPSNGAVTVFDDDSTTPLLVGVAYEDVAGTQTYQGNGADRIDRLV